MATSTMVVKEEIILTDKYIESNSSTETGFAEPDTIRSGSKSLFTVLMTTDAITNEAQTYDITLQWNNSDFNAFSARVLSSVAVNSADEPEQAE
jgi:hypothetical protein